MKIGWPIQGILDNTYLPTSGESKTPVFFLNPALQVQLEELVLKIKQILNFLSKCPLLTFFLSSGDWLSADILCKQFGLHLEA